MKKRIFIALLVIIVLILAFILIQRISLTENKLKELQSQLDEKNKEPAVVSVVENKTESIPENLADKPNLASWMFSDVFNGLRKTTNKINFSDNYTYVYNDDGSFFSRNGPIFPVDPFSEIIHNDVGFEIRFSHFRVYNLGEGASGNEKYNDYVNKVERKDNIDVNMTCSKSDECRNIKLITCLKNSQNAYIWFIDTYLFSAYDQGEMFDIFKNFYC